MPTDPDAPHISTPVNPFWKAVIVTGFLFVGTTLAIVMTPYGEQKSPVNIFLRKHGALLASIEVGAVLVSGVVQPRYGWRAVFFIGILPSLFTLWIQWRVQEPAIWTAASRVRGRIISSSSPPCGSTTSTARGTPRAGARAR